MWLPQQAVLIAGDLYDRDWQDFHTGLFVREQMVRLGRAGVKVFIVQGNHDAQGVISRQLPWPDNVKVFSSRSAETSSPKQFQLFQPMIGVSAIFSPQFILNFFEVFPFAFSAADRSRL